MGPYKPQRLRPLRGKPEFPKKPMTRVDTPAEDQILIEVPALVDEDLFAAAQEQLEENRKRSRARARGATYLLQGLIVCKGCGYACHGATASARTPDGRVAYAYYRCRGSERVAVRRPEAVPDQGDPDRPAGRGRVGRRLARCCPSRSGSERSTGGGWRGRRGGQAREAGQLAKLINQVRKTISRLIDAYGDGLLEKSEFEPRVTAARERLSRLEEEHERRAEEEDREAELRLVIGQLEEFASRVSEGLEGTDWSLRAAPSKVFCNIVGGVQFLCFSDACESHRCVVPGPISQGFPGPETRRGCPAPGADCVFVGGTRTL